jgi:hypothetical protein
MGRRIASEKRFAPMADWLSRFICKNVLITIDTHADSNTGFLSHAAPTRKKGRKGCTLLGNVSPLAFFAFVFAYQPETKDFAELFGPQRSEGCG